ncbi:hypothetical protein AB0D74_03470 [Streptomyces sp. NPDC048278]|uniref:hypothetical protein n=1 Tax=Streptomyces sp. NPDC048278 TaxID=3155809 RepID=UPI00342A7E1A
MDGLAWDTAQPRESVLCRIVCESAAVTVAVRRTGNGARLQLTSERSGLRVLLDATVLDALCALTPDRAAELVRASTERVTEVPV